MCDSHHKSICQISGAINFSRSWMDAAPAAIRRPGVQINAPISETQASITMNQNCGL
jgi:hypothetical protein